MKKEIKKLTIAQAFRKEGKRWALTPRDIADRTGLSVKGVIKLVREMEKDGYLKIIGHESHTYGTGTRNIYSLTKLGETIYLN